MMRLHRRCIPPQTWCAASSARQGPMNISRAALFWLLLLPALRPSLAAEPSLADTTELQAWVDAFVAKQMQDNRIPGAIVSVVKDGQILLSKGYGLSDIEHHRAVDPHKTLFR